VPTRSPATWFPATVRTALLPRGTAVITLNPLSSTSAIVPIGLGPRKKVEVLLTSNE